MPLIDMSGWIMKEHGVPDSRITVLKRDMDTKTSGTSWICQCECGKIFSAKGTKIRSGWTKSCGCLQKEVNSKRVRADLTGQRFGKLIAIKPIGARHRSVLWECKCDCGNIKLATSNNLCSGQTRSCGCLKSYGEYLVKRYLTEHNINYQSEYSLGNLRNIPRSYTRIDFAIIKNNLPIGFIEIDGVQHYDENNPWHNQGVEINSKLKEEYAKEHNIPLLHLFYNEGYINFNELEDFLLQIGV